ncbi:galactose-binding domain-like protein [Lanmaoa asiatica]|nr:galactose-binding domain-like protein [Lanmaoa asiatica]
MSTSDGRSNSVATELDGADHSNLFSYIDRDNVHGLNLAVPEQAKELIKPWSDREETTQFADSGVDDQVRTNHGGPGGVIMRPCLQMIIHIPFSQNVRIKSVILKLGRGETTPRHLKIFANYPNIIDFADAENTKPHLDMSLLEGEAGAVEYPLRVAAFTSVHALSLYFVSRVLLNPPACPLPGFAAFHEWSFFSFEITIYGRVIVRLITDSDHYHGQGDSVGGDLSRLYYVGFKGDSRTSRKEGTNKLEIPAADAADAPLVDRLKQNTGGQQTMAR